MFKRFTRSEIVGLSSFVLRNLNVKAGRKFMFNELNRHAKVPKSVIFSITKTVLDTVDPRYTKIVFIY